MKRKDVNLILTDGGAGDLICELVAVDYNIKHNPHIQFHVWVPDYLGGFAYHVLNGGAIVKPFSQKSQFNQKFQGATTEWISTHTARRTHPVDYGFHMLADRHVYDLNQKNYLKIRPDEIDVSSFDLPEKYVCLVATGAEPVKTFPAEVLNELSAYVLHRGYTPVFLGKEESKCGFKDFSVKAKVVPIDHSKGLNLINRTSLLECARVIHGAKCFVGIDGGVVHLAGCTDVAILAGYSLVDPVHVAPIREGSQKYKFQAVEPDLFIKNRYFQTYNTFVDGDCRVFPGWESVIGNLTAQKFINKLEVML